jgi:CRP-like cAMP-binding protein
MAGVRSLIFMLDVGSHFFTTYIDKDHEVVTDRKKIAWRYLRSTCLIDSISSLPWGLLSGYLAFLELLRCFTAPFIMRRMLESYRILDSVQRLACWGMFQLLCFLLLYLHWVACLWYVVSKDGWFATHANPVLGLDEVDPYFVSLEASLHLTVGASGLPDCVPTNTREAKVQSLILVMGACIVSGIFGEMASLLADFNSDATEYHRKMGQTITQLKQMQVPYKMQKRAREYLEYTYNAHRWRHHGELFETLNPVLATEIYACTDREMIGKAFIFSGSSKLFLNALVRHMQRITYQHNDPVITEGEIGDSMYFLRKGVCKVYAYCTLVNRLTPGSGFGEIALVLRCRRTSTVRCDGICELSRLQRASVQQLAKEYPSDLQAIKAYAMEKATQMRMYNRMTLLNNECTLSAESKALLVISKHVQQWLTRLRARKSNAKPTAAGGAEAAAGVFTKKLNMTQSWARERETRRRYSFQSTELGGDAGKEQQKETSPNRHDLMQQRHQSKLVLEQKLQSWKKSQQKDDGDLQGENSQQPHGSNLLSPIGEVKGVGGAPSMRRSSRRASNSLQAQATMQAALSTAQADIRAAQSGPLNSHAMGSHSQSLLVARVEGVERAVKDIRSMFEQSLANSAQQHQQQEQQQLHQQQQQQAFSKLVTDQMAAMREAQTQLLVQMQKAASPR